MHFKMNQKQPLKCFYRDSPSKIRNLSLYLFQICLSTAEHKISYLKNVEEPDNTGAK